MKRTIPRLLATVLLAGLVACSAAEAPPDLSLATPSASSSVVELVHVHGLSYTADGSRILIPSHVGLAVFSNGQWSKAAGPAHDYMGFAASHNALYSSGHPAPDSGLINPFGLIKSTDGGATWTKLGLEGESDFHNLAVGYHSNAIYVFNSHPNSRMPSAGLYATLDDGRTWRQAKAAGLDSEPFTLAVHPSDPSTVAIAGKAGLYLSQDGGDSFRKVVATDPLTAVAFDHDGRRIWIGSYASKPALYQWSAKGGLQRTAWPDGETDPIAYIGQSPVQASERAIATFTRNVYRSEDDGLHWQPIALSGKPQDLK